MENDDVYTDIQNTRNNGKSAKTTMFIFAGFAAVGVLVLVIALPIYFSNNPTSDNVENPLTTAMEGILTDSGYVEVRSDAYLFWLLYYREKNYKLTDFEKLDPIPLIIWLQGGPGGASTGYGLFEEIGPLDLNFQPRPTSWTDVAHVLFIDQPVGTGYSYVTNDNAYAKDFTQAGKDIVVLLNDFFEKKPELKDNPLYIFCQSYGGKFAVSAAAEIAKNIKDGSMDLNFKGVGLGSAYISPEDSLLSWANYMHQWSLLNTKGRQQVNESAMAAKKLIDNEQWLDAYNKKMETQNMVKELSDNANIYNILYPHYPDDPQTDPYDDLMQNWMPDYLGSIPSSVVWGSQRSGVEKAMEEDFMKPVNHLVDSLLEDGYKVAVYNGMLDMIVSTPGQESWVEKLQWDQIESFQDKDWTPELDSTGETSGFSKSQENFKFWWVIKAGHDIPIDQAEFARRIMYDTCSVN